MQSERHSNRAWDPFAKQNEVFLVHLSQAHGGVSTRVPQKIYTGIDHAPMLPESDPWFLREGCPRHTSKKVMGQGAIIIGHKAHYAL